MQSSLPIFIYSILTKTQVKATTEPWTNL